MNTRILHCSNSLDNYYICIHNNVAGFMNRGPEPGDRVYLVVRYGKKSICGARFILDQVTDYKPWPDAERYVHCLTFKDIEFCEPFEINKLAEVGGPHWNLKYLQGSKAIKDGTAIGLLDELFAANKTDSAVLLEPIEEAAEAVQLEFESIEDTKTLKSLMKEIPDLQIQIMGTFQTVNFINETDKVRGLERLVNDSFYSLFSHFEEERAVLIPENRLFKTQGIKKEGTNILGIRGIPYGLLISFTKNLRKPIQINLIEYECYGESKTKASDKSNYLNSQIIPQLMRFASSFSIITEQTTREASIKKWIDKIIEYINDNETLERRVSSWIREIKPDIKEKSIDREIQKSLHEAFSTNIRILLIIDELSSEQRDTIRNVIKSFRLENGESVSFDAYVVRLVQRIDIINSSSEYALTVQ